MSQNQPGVDRRRQLDLFGAPVEPGPRIAYGQATRRAFYAPDPRDIFLGQTRLDTHLQQAGLKRPLQIAELLDARDWSAFEARYAPQGRAPYAPRCMLGLILYGIMQGVSSLRELETLARSDLGCMWVSGGITPDHANIGRFITLHDDLLSGAFFEQLTGAILTATGADNRRLAGDGTVIEAACSHYRLVQREAARQHADSARRDAQRHPDEPQRADAAARAETVAATIEQRHATRAAKGKPVGHLRISPTEPDAMVQHLKRGRGAAPSWKPSVLANAQRVVVALGNHASSETAQVPGLIEQSRRTTGSTPQELLLDAGYCSDGVIEHTLERDISLLCPQGKAPGQPRASRHFFSKDRFTYHPDDDVYICPAGQRLIRVGRYRGNADTPGYTEYQTTACGHCALQARCTRARHGRKVKRYAGDEAKEALRMVMAQPQARRIFGQRKAMVEPVFSSLRQRQGLNRFRRRGQAGVRREFALHILAHNLSRAIALMASCCFIRSLCAVIRAYWPQWPHPDRAKSQSPIPALA